MVTTKKSKPAAKPAYLKSRKEGAILLADGSYFRGFAFGGKATKVGEFVFHTSYSGYQEILTDPSYQKQVLVFSSVQIGNQGFHVEDWESSKMWASGCVMRSYFEGMNQWRNQQSLASFLEKQNRPALYGVDTRRLVLRIRDAGAIWGVISTEFTQKSKLKKILEKSSSNMEGLALAAEVSSKSSYEWREPSHSLLKSKESREASASKVCVVYDFGVKRQILRYLVDAGFEKLIVVPSSTSAESVLAMKPDAVLLSNGPGDPSAEIDVIEEVKKLVGKLPILGICLGHQILSLALGLSTYKLRFGHHAANHPVKNLRRNRVEITSQNHGFAVLDDSRQEGLEFTHINLNDGTIAGFIHKDMNLCGIQFHPESSPGPIDSVDVFQDLYRGVFA